MTTNEKQYSIYLRKTKERIPVTKKEFEDYYRGINAYRRTEMNAGRCVCPKNKWLSCDMDCLTCPFHRHSNLYSLDTTVNTDDEEPRAWVEDMPDNNRTMEELFEDVAEICQILVRLFEIMPEAASVGNLRLQGLTETAISERLGINRTTLLYRLNKAKAMLSDEFPDFFEKNKKIFQNF